MYGPLVVSLFLSLTGLVIGSFLGALTYRLPRKVSISEGRSKCPNCGSEIRWFDNIPLISFLLLRGKCRNCKKGISIRYPLIEGATAISFVLIGFNPFNLIVACILIAIFVIDLEQRLIFDELVYSGIFIVLVKIIITNSPFLFQSLLAGFVSALILLFLNIITKGRGMGLGDVKLAILIGMLIGIDKLLIWLFFSFVAGAIVGIILMVLGKATVKAKVAFGPFLIIGIVLTNLFSNWFLKLLHL